MDIHNAIICVASGCHSSHCMVSGGIVIDLMHIAEADVDLEQKTITVGGGAYLKVSVMNLSIEIIRCSWNLF